ncbi:cupredoxin domain-containing protein [Aurantivibrio plasticivorans]
MLIINIAGVILIALIIWWFWLYKPKAEQVGNDDLVVVVENGVYKPSHILMDGNDAHGITFLRKDASPCAETLLIPELEISETLPLNKPTKIHIPPLNAGEYAFHCQMQMYKGTIKVEGDPS